MSAAKRVYAMPLDAGLARKTLAAIRLFNGTTALFVPEFLLRRLGVDPEVDSSGVYPFRMFGIRTILIGADLLLLQGEQRRHATQLAVLIHGADTVSAATAAIRGNLPRKAGIMTTMISAGNTILALVATRENNSGEPQDEMAHNTSSRFISEQFAARR
jgi:hypothetical protein